MTEPGERQPHPERLDRAEQHMGMDVVRCRCLPPGTAVIAPSLQCPSPDCPFLDQALAELGDDA